MIPRKAHTVKVIIIAAHIGRLNRLTATYKVYAPTIMISPCAKLIIFAIPYTIVYPSAIRAYILPVLSPFINCSIRFINIVVLLFNIPKNKCIKGLQP